MNTKNQSAHNKTQQKTNTSLATGLFFSPLFHAGGLSSFFTRGDRAEVPLVGLRNDACGTSRRPGMMVAFVFVLKGGPPKTRWWFLFCRKTGGVIVLIDSSGSIIKHFFKGGPPKNPLVMSKISTRNWAIFKSHYWFKKSFTTWYVYSKQHMAKQRYEQAYANNCCTW